MTDPQINIIHEIPPKFPKGTWVGVDIEIFNGDDNLLHLPTGDFASLQIATEEKDVYVITEIEKVKPALNAIKNCMWVGMNFQFDAAYLKKWTNMPDRDLLWDIMLIDKLLWSGYFELFSFSLADLVRRYFSIHLDKKVREQFNTATELTQEMIHYGALDAYYQLMVGKKQAGMVTKDQYEKIYQDIDLSAMWALLASKPFRIDKDSWITLAEKHERIKEEIDAALPFNPRSKAQVVDFLSKCGFPNIEDSRAETLEFLVEKHPNTEAAKWASMALEGKKAGTYSSKYGFGFIEKFIFAEEDYWVVKPDYFVIGAETSRTSCRNPPMHQIPIRETKAFRDCFIARPGHKLIIADYKAQEPRITAYLSQDKRYIDVMNSGQDIYLKTGEFMYETEEENIANRPETKTMVLGTSYGLTKWGLSQKWGVSKEVAQDYIDKFFKPFPKLKKYLEKQGKKRDYVETAMGRKLWLNPYSFQVSNNAKNSPIQGTAADMMKRAIAVAYRDWNYSEWGDWALVETVHDEKGYDVPEEIVPEVTRFVRKVMVEVAQEMCPGVLFDVDITVCDKWSEAK